jgi:hypothetical protein
VDVSILVNKTVHRNSSLLLTLCSMDAAKPAKSLFLQFQYKIQIFINTYSNHKR